jgi:putative component of membrane protein insertase Oxa1/YidC/SpoIIIJ protein YidD
VVRATIGTASRVGPLEYLAAYLIRLYQRHLSPRKGFSCPHRLLHGGLSCSEYGRQMVLSHGVQSAYRLIRQRLDECRSAAHKLWHHSQTEDDSSDGQTGETPGTNGNGEAGATPAPARRRLFGTGRRAAGEVADDVGAVCDLTDLSCHALDCGTDHCHMPNCDLPDCNGCDSCSGCGSHVLIIAALLGWAAR